MPAPKRASTTTQRKRKPRTAAAEPPTPDPVTPPEEKDDRWWVLVVASVADLGAGRYGVWANKPKFQTLSDDQVMIGTEDDDEPTLVVNMRDSLTVAIGQIEHFNSVPKNPGAPQSSDGEVHEAS